MTHPNGKSGGFGSLAWSPIKNLQHLQRGDRLDRGRPRRFPAMQKDYTPLGVGNIIICAEHLWTDRPAANPLERCDPPLLPVWKDLA